MARGHRRAGDTSAIDIVVNLFTAQEIELGQTGVDAYAPKHWRLFFCGMFEISDTASLTRLSVPDQKRIDAATPVTGLTHEQIERECGYVIGDRINRCIDPLMHDLQVAAAGFAGFRLDRCGIRQRFPGKQFPW